MGRRAGFLIVIAALMGLAILLLALRRVEPRTVRAVRLSGEHMKELKEPETRDSDYIVSSARMQIRAITLAAALFIAAIAAVLFAVRPTSDSGIPETPFVAGGATVTAPASTGETGTGAPGGSGAPEPVRPTELVGVDVSRLRLPTLGIDAPIVTMGVDADGTMQSPTNPTDVAWYSFSARPGELSNVVMAGHLDYVNYGPAVFYRLKDARMGDEVELVLVDGSIARYRVMNVTTYDEATAPVLEIVGPTKVETVTLITCGGSFDPLSREYDRRVVLRAERIDEVAVAH